MGKTYEDLANFYCMVFAHHLLIYFMATLETPLICYMDGITGMYDDKFKYVIYLTYYLY